MGLINAKPYTGALQIYHIKALYWADENFRKYTQFTYSHNGLHKLVPLPMCCIGSCDGRIASTGSTGQFLNKKEMNNCYRPICRLDLSTDLSLSLPERSYAFITIRAQVTCAERDTWPLICIYMLGIIYRKVHNSCCGAQGLNITPASNLFTSIQTIRVGKCARSSIYFLHEFERDGS